MDLLRSRKRTGSWLLALLLFSSAWRMLPLCVRRAGPGCATRAHACCCGHSGQACSCDGHHGVAPQLASLSACPGAGDIPVSVLALPPALLPAASAILPAPPATATLRAAAPAALPATTPQPSTPPPQAA